MSNPIPYKETDNQTFSDELHITEKSDKLIKVTDGDFYAYTEVLDNPSVAGINGDVTDGYIRKLAIYNRNSDLVFNYDKRLDFSLLDPVILSVFLSQIEQYAKNNIF